MDRNDLTQEAEQIFYAAGSFHRKAFDIVDQAKTREDYASLEALAECAIIKTFDLKKIKAHPYEHIPKAWTAQKVGVVPQ